MTRALRLTAGGGLWLTLALPTSRTALEAVMTDHMLVQIPLLALAGWLAAGAFDPPQAYRAGDWRGWTGTVAVLVVSSFWMLPRMLDVALVDGGWELAKFLTLPLMVGVPLRWSWPALSPLGRAFVLTNAISMAAFVGWLYLAAPLRVCVYYLADQQLAAGKGLLWVALAGGLVFLLRCLLGPFGRPFLRGAAGDPINQSLAREL
jgi:hypothetical protein